MSNKQGIYHEIGVSIVGFLALVMVSSPKVQAGGCYPAATVYRSGAVYSQISYAPANAKVSYSTYSYVPAAPIKAVPAVYAPDFYSSVQDYYRDKVLVDAVAGKALEVSNLKQELTTLKQAIQQSLQNQQQYQQPQRQEYQSPLQYPHPSYPPRDNRSGQGYYPPHQPTYPAPMPRAPENGYQQSPHNGYSNHHNRAPQQPHGHDQYQRQLEHQQQYQKAPASPVPRPYNGHHGGVPENLPIIVHNKCLACHGDTYQDDGDGFDLRNLEAVPSTMRALCWGECAAGNMPKGRAKLDPSEVMAFKQWAQMGRVYAQSARRE